MTSKKQLDDYEAVFWALAHASRRHIIVCLAKDGPMLGGQLADQLACSWPTTTGHLQTLEKAGLVTVRRDGREQIYKLNRARLHIVESWLKLIRDHSSSGS